MARNIALHDLASAKKIKLVRSASRTLGHLEARDFLDQAFQARGCGAASRMRNVFPPRGEPVHVRLIDALGFWRSTRVLICVPR